MGSRGWSGDEGDDGGDEGEKVAGSRGWSGDGSAVTCLQTFFSFFFSVKK